jgi:hypothetical protein
MVTLVSGSGSGPVIAGVSGISLTLGLLVAAYHHIGLDLPSWVYLGLLWLGTVGGALVNGYRDGGLVVSWAASTVGVLPMAVAFAPSGPPEIHLSLGDILLKAAGGALVVGLVAGSFSHGVGLALDRGHDALRGE